MDYVDTSNNHSSAFHAPPALGMFLPVNVRTPAHTDLNRVVLAGRTGYGKWIGERTYILWAVAHMLIYVLELPWPGAYRRPISNTRNSSAMLHNRCQSFSL
jgi:hypothetical protein